ncbi:MAG: helix-turn-helix domain-containing protein [candidate division Zixibacteria bacterium]|nr:helix-turn-helix domain-containing protein [candidate division Zixibacteria bacterium]
MPDAVPPEGFVVCNLSQIMDERQLGVQDVALIANLSRPTVRKLRDNRIERISMSTISKLCSSLHVGIGVLFRHYSPHEWNLLKIEMESQALMGADES